MIGLPLLVLVSHIVLVILVAALLAHNTWGRKVKDFLGRHALWLGLFVTLVAVLGSLFYSQVKGFEPCVLCWWQRVLIYPQPLLFLIALKFKDRTVFRYVASLAALALIIGLYQSYTSLGGASVLPCTAVGGACSKVYVKEFGYITIPLMSATISLYVLLLAWANKLYKRD
jgi:disulfide bond formation protein DsbB